MNDEELDAIVSICEERETKHSQGRWFSTAARYYIPALVAEVRRLRDSARADSGV